MEPPVHPARYPPRHHAPHRLVRGQVSHASRVTCQPLTCRYPQVGRGRTHHLRWLPQHGRPRVHVLLLLHVQLRTQRAEVPLVEEVSKQYISYLCIQ